MYVDTNSCWLKHFRLGMVKNGYDQKMTCQLWIDGIKGFFAYWGKFRKAKSYFNNFWSYFNNFCVGVVKNGHDGHVLVHGTLKFAGLENELMDWADILHADRVAIMSGETLILISIFSF